MPTTPMCQSNCPSTMTKSFCASNFERTTPMTSSTIDFSIFCRSRFRKSRFCASGMASSKFSASSKCNDSSAVSKRPAAFKSRRELKTDFVSADFFRRLRDFFQRENSGALGFVQLPQTGGNQNPIFADERNQIRNRAERDQIQQRFQIKFRRAGQIGFAPAFDERVREFEGESGGTKFAEVEISIFARKLRIHERDGVGRGIGNLMMVEDNHVHAASSRSE